MRRTARIWLPGLALVGVVAACGAESGPGAGSPAPRPAAAGPLDPGWPDVVLVTLDTTRADHLGCYGYFRDTSPRLDELAAEALLFERALVPMATTLPTHTSMLTAVWPEEHGVLANLRRQTVYERDATLTTLAEVFADAGYDTGAFVSAFPLRRDAGLTDGFDVYDEPEGREQRPAVETTDAALAWLARERTAPFFLWAHYFDPHSPYIPPPPYDKRFHKEPALTAWLAEREIDRISRRQTKRKGRVVVADVDTNLYDGEIAYMDHHVGRLLDALRARPRWERTIVAVLGDHGEGLNQHDEAGHGLAWDEQIRVPFLLRIPGVAPARNEDLVSAVDLAPTLLGLVPLPGRERLLSRATGVDVLAADFAPRPLLAQTSDRKEQFGDEVIALTTPRWKYLDLGTEGEELYDLQADPHELVNLAAEHPEVLAEMRAEARRTLEAQRARGGGRARAATEAERAALEELGYGGDGDEDE